MNRTARGRPALLRRRRRAAWIALVVLVVAVHGCVTRELGARLADLRAERAMPARIEVAYVREMTLAAPPPTAAPAAPPPPAAAPRAVRPRPVRAPKPASAPLATEVGEPVEPVPPPAAATPEVVAAAPPEPAPSAPESVASAPESPVATASAPEPAASAPPAFEWPASTRVSYVLTGNYRGGVNGTAQVEWVRDGARYQVHLDLVVGPSAAPVITRRMSSDGEITAAGLAPRRFDQDTKVMLRERTRATLVFEPGSVVLANGERRDAVPGVQDTASQFVQLSYVFGTRPELLRVGGQVDIPLALPHKVDVWTYDVVAEAVLDTPFGPLPAVHLKPRRTASGRGTLSAEIWFAPQLRYLPARIRIEQDKETFIDLMIARRPEIAN